MELLGLRILPNCLLLRPEPDIPLDRLRPVVVHGGTPTKPAMGARRIEPGERPSLMIPTDLRPFVTDPHARLQIWADGFRLLDTPLFPHGGAIAGVVEGMVDHCVTGWAANIVGEALPGGTLYVDGVATAEFVADIGRRDLGGVGPLATCAGFAVPLPVHALDGREHEVVVGFGPHRMDAITVRARPRFRLERAAADIVRLWFFDRGQPDGPATITLRHESGRVLQSGPTFERGDTGERFGRWHTGLDAILRDWPAGRIDICAGRDANLVFASLQVSTPKTQIAAHHELAATMLRLEQAGGPALSRGLLATMRQAGTLAESLGTRVTHRSGSLGRSVSVVVPVYRGVEETTACLAALRRSIAAGDEDIGELLLLDDHAPEPAMAALLAAQPGRIGDCAVRVHRNDRNLGFVGTANVGLRLADPDCDVILLNNDAVVTALFAARLKAAAHAEPRIATATPLSNDATLLGVPRVDCRNELSADDAPRIDALLQTRDGPRAVAIPVGHGFCMYLKREALDDVGALDPVWGRGYCEEVDWCLAASDRGWSHVAALDTYVHHASSVSFGARERTALMAHNHALLERKYPDFVPRLRDFLIADPIAPIRLDVFCDFLARGAQPCLLHVIHAMGGGTGVLMERYADAFAGAGGMNLICTNRLDGWLGAEVDEVVWRETGLALRLPSGGLADFLDRLVTLGLPGVRALVHSLIGAGPAARELATRWAIPYAVCAHDYQWICPRVTLVDQTDRFCGVPGGQYCQLCVRANDFYDFGAAAKLTIEADLPAWLGANRALLAGAAAVVAPSADTAARLARYFDLGHVRVVAHPEPVATATLRRGPDDAAMTRIAVVGGINIAKGMLVLRDLGRHIDQTGAAARVTLFGEVSDPAAFARIGSVEIRGRYTPPDLPALLAAYDPHVVFFPAVWPETYCFVLSEIWAAGYPAASFDLGAVAERIMATGGGVVLPFETDPAALLPRLMAARADLASLAGLELDIGSPWDRDDPTLRRLFGA